MRPEVLAAEPGGRNNIVCVRGVGGHREMERESVAGSTGRKGDGAQMRLSSAH